MALKFRKDGHTQEETAKRFGVSQKVISRWEGQGQKASATNTTLGIGCKPRRRGTLKIKIPKGEYEVIYDRSKAGESEEQIASNYKVSQQSISKIIRKDAEKKEKEKQAEETKPKSAKLILGDFRQVQSQIDAQSIDLIFTDPPYGEEYLDLWEDLGKFALRVLKPGGYFVAYAPHPFLPTVLKALGKYLDYYWIGGVNQIGGEPRIWNNQIWIRWKPIIIFSHGKGRKHEWMNDLIEGKKGDKDLNEWTQGEGEASYFIEKLTLLGEIVLDPMMGIGTTIRAALNLKRQAIGIEKDPKIYSKVSENG